MAKFTREIIEWTQIVRARGGQVMRKIGLDAFRGVMLRSPVDEGRFRASHRISLNVVDASVEPPPNTPSGKEIGQSPDQAEFQKASAALRGASWKDTIHLTNNLPYARRLEDGSSAQNNHQVDGIYGATFAELRANLTKSILAARSS